jgi:hypothetical protein
VLWPKAVLPRRKLEIQGPASLVFICALSLSDLLARAVRQAYGKEGT